MGPENKEKQELKVLVTGFGPFRKQYPINLSWEIAKSLPSYLPSRQFKDAAPAITVQCPAVRILVQPEPVRVSYEFIRDLVPRIWNNEVGTNFDMAIHIGMSGPRSVYQIERRAHRRGYKSVDIDVASLEDGPDGKPDDEDWLWYGLPDELLSDFDIDDVYKRWRADSPGNADLRISEDPGRYLCDFIYYSSLAHLRRANRPSKVVFLHVPCSPSDTSIALGRELTLSLIRALVESETAKFIPT